MSSLVSEPRGAHVHFDICDLKSGPCCDNYFCYLTRNVWLHLSVLYSVHDLAEKVAGPDQNFEKFKH